MADQHDPNGAYSEVFEEGSDLKHPQTVHRIRANSSIMQLKKILGERLKPQPLSQLTGANANLVACSCQSRRNS